MISPSELISAPSRLLFRSFGVAVFGIVLADLPPRTVAHRRSGNGFGLLRCLLRPIRSLSGLRRLTLLLLRFFSGLFLYFRSSRQHCLLLLLLLVATIFDLDILCGSSFTFAAPARTAFSFSSSWWPPFSTLIFSAALSLSSASLSLDSTLSPAPPFSPAGFLGEGAGGVLSLPGGNTPSGISSPILK